MQVISIIVPVYNNEDTIIRCLDSIIVQDWQEKEIIVIDDGSTDNSLRLCLEFSKNHQNVVVLSQTHSGVSKSRNFGLQSSSGEFIVFCDADDELLPAALSSMINSFDSSIDLVVCNVDKVNSPCICENKVLSKRDALYRFFRHDDKRLLGSVYGKTFRSSIISPKNETFLTFNETVSIGEDALFLLQYIECCSKIQLRREYVYKHYCNNNGIIRSSCLRNYLSALYASHRMITTVSYDPYLFTLAINDLCHVFVQIIKRFSSITQAEAAKQAFLKIVHSLNISIRFLDVPCLIKQHGILNVYFIPCIIKNESSNISINVDMSHTHVLLAPVYQDDDIFFRKYSNCSFIFACEPYEGEIRTQQYYLLDKGTDEWSQIIDRDSNINPHPICIVNLFPSLLET